MPAITPTEEMRRVMSAVGQLRIGEIVELCGGGVRDAKIVDDTCLAMQGIFDGRELTNGEMIAALTSCLAGMLSLMIESREIKLDRSRVN
jgi:hypothetical protein